MSATFPFVTRRNLRVTVGAPLAGVTGCAPLRRARKDGNSSIADSNESKRLREIEAAQISPGAIGVTYIWLRSPQ